MSSGGTDATDLRFELPSVTDAAHADLVFGASFEAPRNVLHLRAVLPLPTAHIHFIPPAKVALQATLPPPTVSTLVLRPSVPLFVGGELGGSRSANLPGVACMGEVRYASHTQRPTVGKTTTPWQVAQQTENGATQGQQDGQRCPVGWSPPWQWASSLQIGLAHDLPPVLVPMVQQRTSGMQQALRLHDVTRFGHQDGHAMVLLRRALFQNASRLRASTHFAHQDADRSKRAGRVNYWQSAHGLFQRQGSDFQSATAWPVGWAGRYQEAMRPPPGICIRVVPPPPQVQACYTPSAHLLFDALAPASTHLLFVCERKSVLPPIGETVWVPIRKVYVVINQVRLYRWPDGIEVPAFNLSLSLDVASWCWGFDAQLPERAQTLLAPGGSSGPVELLARVNGKEFRLLAEDISRERSFGEARIRVSGRGRHAVLAAPYAPVMSFGNADARSARQLMDDVLTLNGISLGWDIDWDLADWNVPAGVFAHQGSWIEALNAIASSAGGYLQPHASDKRFRVRHRFPVAPWKWLDAAQPIVPDFVLPVDVVSRESIRWLQKPAYNRVFVSGQERGVLGQVTRAGSAGDVLAPMVVDSLITDAVAARQRGIAILADTGQQVEVSLRMPVLQETGIIEAGAFVQYRDGVIDRLGLVRSTQIEAGFPEVWQTLGVWSPASASTVSSP
ncbi:hypothetical protein [Ottowia testudinis]|uniref:Uncharacterized protein n=1 Tax=Ottowia testudinis TaxID=2816950 RepID=A0A975CDH4_9BURK|nr:hypothetical protein [Ottowia testudinis]QTD44390.1 hypothetical protein J1M35_14965 [Ottowia testudinis]